MSWKQQIRVKPDLVHKSNLYKIRHIFTNIYIYTYKIFTIFFFPFPPPEERCLKYNCKFYPSYVYLFVVDFERLFKTILKNTLNYVFLWWFIMVKAMSQFEAVLCHSKPTDIKEAFVSVLKFQPLFYEKWIFNYTFCPWCFVRCLYKLPACDEA